MTDIDYNKLIERNKHKIYKKLIKLEEINPDDKFEFLGDLEDPDEKSKWEIELLLNDSILCYWRMSGSMFEQICRHNKKNNTNIFYVQPDRKIRVGRSPTWLLKLSTTPIDKPSNQKIIDNKEQPNVAQQQPNRSPGVSGADATPIPVSSHTEQPEVAPEEAQQDTSTPKSVEAELTTTEEPVEEVAAVSSVNKSNDFALQKRCSEIYYQSTKILHKVGKGFIGVMAKQFGAKEASVAKMWLFVMKKNLPILNMDNGEPLGGVNRAMIDKISYQCRELLGIAHPVPAVIPDATKVVVEAPVVVEKPFVPKPIQGVTPEALKKAKENIEEKGFGNIFDDDEDMTSCV